MKYSRPHKTRFRKNPLYALVLLALASPYANAEIISWTGAENNDFSNEANWETIEDPENYHHVINTSPGGFTPELTITNDWSPSIYSLQIGNASGKEGQLSISKADDAGSYIFLSNMQVGLDGGTGELTIYKNDNLDPGQRKVLDVQTFNIGEGAGSAGTVNILGSGKTLEEQSGASSETVGGHNLDLRVGLDGGTGKVNLNGASLASASGKVYIGSGSNSVGEVNVLGGGKLAHGIMYSGMGTEAVIGREGGTGTLNVSGISAAGYRSIAHFGQGLTLGDAGTGSAHVGENGRLLTYGDSTGTIFGEEIRVQLGVNGGTGKVTVDGANATWMVGGYAYYGSPSEGEDYNKGQLYLGASGTGEVTLANGGELTIGEANFEYVYNEETGSGYYDLVSFTDGTGVLYLGHEAGSQGTLNIGAAQGQAAQGTGVLKAKEIQFGDGTGTLVFNHTDNTGGYAFDTPLISSAGTGQGHIVQVAGVTAFNADQNQYTGNIGVTGGTLAINGEMLNTSNTTVGGGVLAVNGTLGSVNTHVNGGVAHVMGRLNGAVNLGGTGVLAGTGSVGTTTVGAGGTVSPGDTLGSDVGTLTFDDVTFNAGSIYKVQVNPDGQSDLIHASTTNGGSGAAVINGGTISLQAGAGNWADNTKYTIITAEGGVTGAFDGVDSNLAFLSAAVQEDANDVYLFLTRNSTGLEEVGETSNEVNTGKGIESLGGGNKVYDTILTMSAEQAQDAYNNLSGEIHASVQSAMLANSRHARAAVNQHLKGLDTREIKPHQNLWVSTWAHDGHLKGDSNASRLNNKGFGVLIGADAYDTGTTTIGAAIGYERSDLDVGGTRSSKADVDAIHLMGYGRTKAGVIDVRGGIGYSWLDVNTTRNITIPALLGENKASYNGGVVQIFAEGSHTFNVAPKIDVTPYLGLAYQRIKTNGFTEKGGDTVLHGNGKSNDVVLSTVGVRGAYSINERSQIYADLGWQHNFSNDAPQARMNFMGGSSFDVRGAKVNANSALIGLGAKFELKSNMTLSVGYEGEFGNQSRDHAGKLLWEIRF